MDKMWVMYLRNIKVPLGGSLDNMSVMNQRLKWVLEEESRSQKYGYYRVYRSLKGKEQGDLVCSLKVTGKGKIVGVSPVDWRTYEMMEPLYEIYRMSTDVLDEVGDIIAHVYELKRRNMVYRRVKKRGAYGKIGTIYSPMGKQAVKFSVSVNKQYRHQIDNIEIGSLKELENY